MCLKLALLELSHAPGLRILGEAIDYARQGQLAAAEARRAALVSE